MHPCLERRCTLLFENDFLIEGLFSHSDLQRCNLDLKLSHSRPGNRVGVSKFSALLLHATVHLLLPLRYAGLLVGCPNLGLFR